MEKILLRNIVSLNIFIFHQFMLNKIEVSLALGLLVSVVMSTFCYEKVLH